VLVFQRKVHRREIRLGVDKGENAGGSENETTGRRICLGGGMLLFATADPEENGQKKEG
jgi:hypothetical protein